MRPRGDPRGHFWNPRQCSLKGCPKGFLVFPAWLDYPHELPLFLAFGPERAANESSGEVLGPRGAPGVSRGSPGGTQGLPKGGRGGTRGCPREGGARGPQGRPRRGPGEPRNAQAGPKGSPRDVQLLWHIFSASLAINITTDEAAPIVALIFFPTNANPFRDYYLPCAS